MLRTCVLYPNLFNSGENKPIAVKTRKFSAADQAVIKAETDRILREDRIEKSKSPWSAHCTASSVARGGGGG